jgi:hypothetical protein
MTKSLKQVIETLLAQGFTPVQVRETLAAEYWIDSISRTFFVNHLKGQHDHHH